MPRGWRHWTVVLRALKRIGVDELDRDDARRSGRNVARLRATAGVVSPGARRWS
jgi:hypothetical protein